MPPGPSFAATEYQCVIIIASIQLHKFLERVMSPLWANDANCMPPMSMPSPSPLPSLAFSVPFPYFPPSNPVREPGGAVS